MRETTHRNCIGDRAGPIALVECAPELAPPDGGDHHHAHQGHSFVELATSDEAINLSIARLQDVAPDWKSGSLDLSTWARTIRDWVDDLWPTFIPPRFGDRPIQPPRLLLSFRRERACVLGHYRPGRNDAGLRFEVSVNPRHLAERPKADVAATVLHELLHSFEDLAGTARLHRNNYHSAWFRQTASTIGIPCSRYGADLGIRPGGPFSAWVARQRLETDGERRVQADVSDQAAQGARPKRIVWTCACRKAVAVSLLVVRGADLSARCERCGERFRRRDAAWEPEANESLAGCRRRIS